MESEQPHWLANYNKQKHTLRLCSYKINIVGKKITDDDVKDIVQT